MDEPRVLFLADQFADAPRDDRHAHPGGAELTDAAALEAAPWPVETARVGHFHPEHLVDFDLHVVANAADAPDALLAGLAEHGRHVLFEHDLRICRWRGNFPISPDPVHRFARRCQCRHKRLRDLYATSLGAIFLTQRQLDHYLENPFFSPPRTAVLGSSLMNRAFLDRANRALESERKRSIEAAILASGHDIKGTAPAREFCRSRGVDPYEIGGLEPEEVLEVLEQTRTFVYLPTGLEPAGRMPVEARFLGCDVVANEFVGVVGESWWNLPDEAALEVLADAPARFWRIVDRFRRFDAPTPDSDGDSLPARAMEFLKRPLVAAAGSLKPMHLVRDVLRDRVAGRRRPFPATDDESVFFG